MASRSERVRLELLSEKHVPHLEALARDPEVRRHTYVPSRPSPGFGTTWLEAYERGRADGTREGFAIVDARDGSFLGLAAAVRLDEGASEAELGYIVAPEARGRGVATDGLRLLTEWALSRGLQRLELRIDADNPASRRVAERCGYVREGLLRSVHVKEGSRSDMLVYARVRTGIQSAADVPALHGRHVVLRPLAVDDVERVAAIQAEPGVVRWWGPPDEADLRRQAEGRTDAKAFAIETEGELVGLIQFQEENEPDFRHAGIDVFLAERVHGRGLGTDAVRTLAHYLVEERGHHRLTIDPEVDNAAAIRAYEKVGFRAVGVMREYWRAPDGSWRDGLLMDLLARELDRSTEAERTSER